MNTHDSTHDRLRVACEAADSFPINLLRSTSFKHKLVAYNKCILEASDDLFDNEPEYLEDAGIKLCEAYDSSSELRL